MQVADLVKADRLNRLNDVCWAVAEERAQRLGNRTHEVRACKQPRAAARVCTARRAELAASISPVSTP